MCHGIIKELTDNSQTDQVGETKAQEQIVVTTRTSPCGSGEIERFKNEVDC